MCIGFTFGSVEVLPQTKNATYGERVKLICCTNPGRVEWEFMKNGTTDLKTICTGNDVYFKVGRYKCENEANEHTLIINSVSVNDSGKYTCIEDGGRGPDSDSSRLIVSRK